MLFLDLLKKENPFILLQIPEGEYGPADLGFGPVRGHLQCPL